MQEAKVLLIEDAPTDAKLFQIAARNARWIKEVRVATDGVEALEILRTDGADKWRPHLMLVDLNMPRMDGFEFLEEVKKDKDLRIIPAIVLTTSAASKDVIASYDRYANCFLTKPPDMNGLSKMLTALEDFWLNVATIPGGL